MFQLFKMSKASRSSTINELNDDVLQQIFKFLPMPDRIRIERGIFLIINFFNLLNIKGTQGTKHYIKMKGKKHQTQKTLCLLSNFDILYEESHKKSQLN